MRTPVRLRVDRIACDGRGLCAELLPELITLDDWGYPIIADGFVPEALEGLARDTVGICPKLALRLDRERGVVGTVGVAPARPPASA
jgi:ferredoxin